MIKINNRQTIVLALYADAPSSRTFTVKQGSETLATFAGADSALAVKAIAGKDISISATGAGGGPSSFAVKLVAPSPTIVTTTITYPTVKLADIEVGGDPVLFKVFESAGIVIQ